MALITLKPTSAGRRAMVRVSTPGLHKGDPYGPLTESQDKTGGRNHYGRITTRHKGGGSKQNYRIIDFKRDKEGIACRVERHRIRSEPHRAHRVAVLRRRRAPLHHRAEGHQRGRPAHRRPRSADQDGQLAAAAQYPGRLDRALHRDEARARVRRSRAVPVLRCSWSRAKALTPRCVFAPAKCAACRRTAARRSVKSATRNTTCASSAKPVRSVGAVFARPFAVRR